MKVQLPNGLIDGADHFKFVTVDELKGKQQNYLVDRALVVGNIGHIPKIVSDLVLTLETQEGLAWGGDKSQLAWKLTATDIETILIAIRSNTFGTEFFHQAVCEHCEHVHKHMKLDLSALEVTPISLQDLMDPAKRTVILPKSEQVVELKPLYLKDLFDVIKTSQNKTDKLITALSVLSIKKLGEKSPVSETDLEELSARDINFLSSVVEKINNGKSEDIILEGSIDTNVEFDCSNCSKESSMKLNVFDPDFFDHSKATTT